MKVRKKTAGWLRRWAAKLDPVKPVEMPTPLEYLSTADLCKEISSRHDASLFCLAKSGKPCPDGEHYMLECMLRVDADPNQTRVMAKAIARAVNSKLG